MLRYVRPYNVWDDVLVLILALVAISALVLVLLAYPEECPELDCPPYACPSLSCGDCPEPEIAVTVEVECPEPEIVVTVILPHLPETGEMK